ncbi:membrane integrity-associated transporter subunit PqiC [Paraburkholderia sp. LEh10]|uniref:PqiC family protein n=1 Tax=Paraburkholderia sp. LEh10 TaxID=2821353 RepID=UPI001AEB0D47|nr:PqiC family protein [Paraburkholderia sp. LEh10]MBP0590779.1 membrane integrity-associated transporter subunit PqiC [Paraburkholderia sp. LEh10]
MMRRVCLLMLMAVSMIVLAACARSPRAEFYTLSAEPMDRLVAPVMPAAIVIDTITVPDLVNRPQFVLRISQSQVRIDEFARWAEPLKNQIAGVLAANLAELFPDAVVFGFPQPAGKPAVRLSVDVQIFDSSISEGTLMVALWSIRYPGVTGATDGKIALHEQVSGPGYDALVDAHSRALAMLSREISQAIISGTKK